MKTKKQNPENQPDTYSSLSPTKAYAIAGAIGGAQVATLGLSTTESLDAITSLYITGGVALTSAVLYTFAIAHELGKFAIDCGNYTWDRSLYMTFAVGFNILNYTGAIMVLSAAALGESSSNIAVVGTALIGLSIFGNALLRGPNLKIVPKPDKTNKKNKDEPQMSEHGESDSDMNAEAYEEATEGDVESTPMRRMGNN